MNDSSPVASSRPKILVTGATGFLGRALVEGFQAAGYFVRSLDIVPPPPGCAPDDCRTGDVADPAVVADACEGIDALVIAHMAPVQPGVYDEPSLPFDINVKGVALLCHEAARRRIPRVVHISSIEVVEVHRRAGDYIARDLPAAPCTLYSLTKHLEEEIVGYHRRAGHFSAISLRPAYVTDADTLLDKYQRKRPSVNWQFIDRRDVAAAAVAALTTGREAQGAYYLHGHPAGTLHMETTPTARDLLWTPRFDFSAWPDDAPAVPTPAGRTSTASRETASAT